MSCPKQQTVQAIHSQMDVFMFRVDLKFAAATRLLEGSRGFGELDFVNIVQFCVTPKKCLPAITTFQSTVNIREIKG